MSTKTIEGIVTGAELAGDKTRITLDFPHDILFDYDNMITMGDRWTITINKMSMMNSEPKNRGTNL